MYTKGLIESPSMSQLVTEETVYIPMRSCILLDFFLPGKPKKIALFLLPTGQDTI